MRPSTAPEMQLALGGYFLMNRLLGSKEAAATLMTAVQQALAAALDGVAQDHKARRLPIVIDLEPPSAVAHVSTQRGQPPLRYQAVSNTWRGDLDEPRAPAVGLPQPPG